MNTSRIFSGGIIASLALHAVPVALLAAGMIGNGGNDALTDNASDGPLVVFIELVEDVPRPPQPALAATPPAPPPVDDEAPPVLETPMVVEALPVVEANVTGALGTAIEASSPAPVPEPAPVTLQAPDVPDPDIVAADDRPEPVEPPAKEPTQMIALATPSPLPVLRVERQFGSPDTVAAPARRTKAGPERKTAKAKPNTAKGPLAKATTTKRRSTKAAKTAQLAQAATGAAASGRTAGSDKKALAAYAGKLKRWVEKHKRYPDAARRAGERGDVTLKVKIARDGGVIAASLLRASGNKLLDADAASLASRAAPFPAMPAELPGNDFSFTVTIRYAAR